MKHFIATRGRKLAFCLLILLTLMACNLPWAQNNNQQTLSPIAVNPAPTEPAYKVKIQFTFSADLEANQTWKAGLRVAAWGVDQPIVLVEENGVETTIYPGPQETLLQNWTPARLKLAQIRKPDGSGYWQVTSESPTMYYFGGGQ